MEIRFCFGKRGGSRLHMVDYVAQTTALDSPSCRRVGIPVFAGCNDFEALNFSGRSSSILERTCMQFEMSLAHLQIMRAHAYSVMFAVANLDAIVRGQFAKNLTAADFFSGKASVHLGFCQSLSKCKCAQVLCVCA